MSQPLYLTNNSGLTAAALQFLTSSEVLQVRPVNKAWSELGLATLAGRARRFGFGEGEGALRKDQVESIQRWMTQSRRVVAEELPFWERVYKESWISALLSFRLPKLDLEQSVAGCSVRLFMEPFYPHWKTDKGPWVTSCYPQAELLFLRHMSASDIGRTLSLEERSDLAFVAAKRGDEVCLRLCLDTGVSPNSRLDRNPYEVYNHSLLHIAAWYGHDSAVSLLLERGADVNAQDAGGYTPLWMAVRALRLSIVTKLIAARADVNRETAGVSPIDLAFSLGEKFLPILNCLTQVEGARAAREVDRYPEIRCFVTPPYRPEYEEWREWRARGRVCEEVRIRGWFWG